MTEPEDGSPGPSYTIPGGGMMGERIRAFDWSKTAIGPMDSWPQSLRTAISIMLSSRYPMFVWWGPEYTNLYNDAYVPILGTRHPDALGRSAPRIWGDIWDVVGPQARAVLEEGHSTWNESQLLVMERHGYTEETYFTFSYSPIIDERGEVGGVFCACSEDTRQVLSERRLETLRKLGERSLVDVESPASACRAAATVFARNRFDIPYSLIYLFDDEDREARLSAADAVPIGTRSSPEVISLDGERDPWRFREALASEAPIIVDDPAVLSTLPAGPWNGDTPARAIVLPLARTGGQSSPAGFVVFGASTRLALNDDYRSFFELAAGQLSIAIANAREYEEEKRRAEALEELDRAKTVFFSNVSHELRTPLTLLLGPIEDILEETDRLPAGIADRLHLARRNAIRLLELVNTLLDFSRIEAGRMEALYEKTDLPAFTTELTSVFRSAIERSGLRLVVDCPPLEEELYVDRQMWERIVLNLLSNALKFTFEGEIRVEVRERDGFARLVVADTGVGIPENELPRLFDRFHRIRGTRARSHEGSGIGLAMVQELVRLHGGTVSVASEPGRGTTFTILIPGGHSHLPSDCVASSPGRSAPGPRTRARVAEALRWLPESDEEHEAEIVSSAPAGSRTAGARIVVADDNADMRDYLTSLLGDRHDVVTCADGDEALEELRRKDTELLLADVMMPGLDGFELLRIIREDERLRSLPVVLLSARAGEEARVEGMEQGANDYLVKPFHARELIARIDAQIELARLRAESERQISESERRLKTLIANLPGMAYRCRNDDDLTMEFISSGVEAITGYPPEDLLEGNVRWADLWHPDDVSWTGEVVSKSIERDRPFQFEYRIIHRDGSIRWVWEQGQPIFDGGDRPVAFEGFVADVTKRKVAEEKTVRLAEDLRTIADNVPALISYVDADARYTFNNRTYLEWFRLEREDVSGRHLRDVLGEQAWNHIRPRVEAALRGERVRYEEEIPYRSGSRYVHVDYVPDIRSDGSVVGFFALVTDLTTHRKAEIALRESEERFRAMADNAPVMSWVTDSDGSCTFLSKPWYEFTGQTPETGLGFGWLDALHPADQERSRKVFLEALSLHERFRLEYRLRRVDGVYRWALETAAPRFGPDGEFFGYIGSIIDITDRKEAEDSLRESALALRQADRLKDEFLATLSHELRTPLTSILGWAQMIGGSLKTEEELRVASEAILRSAQAQKQLVEDVLDVSRITTGRMHIERRPVDLADIVTAAVDTIRPAAEAKRISVSLEIEAELGLAFVDPDRIQQVIWNIVSNAVKFTPQQGHVLVEVSRSGDAASIRIADDGPGIPEHVLPHIFERFRQADSSSRRAHGGLGLGLSLAKELTELHGGTIEVETEPGEGATFTILMPLLSEEALAFSPVEGEEHAPGQPRLPEVKVLLVDDDPDSLLVFGTRLRKEGAHVDLASSVDEALNTYVARPPDIVVTDIAMPGRDGWDLLRAIRSHDQARPVIALTAHDARADVADAPEGFRDYLVKPIDLSDLVTAIEKVLG